MIIFLFSKCITNAYSKCRIYTASLQGARGALTTRPRRFRRHHSVATTCLSNTLWKRHAAAFVLSMLKINAAARRSRRLHSVSTALLAFVQRAPRRSAFFKTLWERCKDATLV